MSIERHNKRTGFYEELDNKKRKEYLSLTRSKILPMVDNLYYGVFLLNDSKFIAPLSHMSSFLKILEEKKDQALALHQPVEFSHGLELTIKSYSFYRFCLTDTDLYDIFIASAIPNDDTPRIIVQLRAFGLWTRGVEDLMVEAYKKVSAICDDHGFTIAKCRESRIDYCYHTNAITSPNKIFRETNGGTVVGLHTNLMSAKSAADLEHVENGTVLHKNYICFGTTTSNNVRARVYDKVKEVIEMGYKAFFFKLWRDSGLISYYDMWCMEYAFCAQNMDYLEKAKIEFYVAHGTDPEKVTEFRAALRNPNTTMKDFKKLAQGFMPKVTAVLNIEYETKRKFYYYSDDFIRDLKTLKRNVPWPLDRIFKILDNRKIFLNYLTERTLSFQKGKDRDGNIVYQDWWERLRNVKHGGVKDDLELIREYAYTMDKRSVQKRAVNQIASSAVYEDRIETGFVEDVSDLMANLSDNMAHKSGRMMYIDENNIAVPDDIYGALLLDYQTTKAKKESRLKNRKRRNSSQG